MSWPPLRQLSYKLDSFTGAVASGVLDLETVEVATLRRLAEDKSLVSRAQAAYLHEGVPLVVVRDGLPFARPAGLVLVISGQSARALLASLAGAGVLSAGRIDSAGPARG